MANRRVRGPAGGRRGFECGFNGAQGKAAAEAVTDTDRFPQALLLSSFRSSLLGHCEREEIMGCICGALRYEIPSSRQLLHLPLHRLSARHGQRILNRDSGAGRRLPPIGEGPSARTWRRHRWRTRQDAVGMPRLRDRRDRRREAGMEPPGYTRIVRAGTLDDTSWVRPTTHFWTRRKQPRVVLAVGDVIYETQPGWRSTGRRDCSQQFGAGP